MAGTPVPEPGDTYSVERTYSNDDVRTFAALSGDDQPRHTEPDADGRLLVHGLLTAALATEVGSDLEVLARTMEMSFRRPVFTGERIVCEATVKTVDPDPDRSRSEVVVDIVCRVEGEPVLTGAFEGFVAT